ncbi:MAG: hypothetical protein ACR2M7_05560 [Bdellovibrionales bacterium]
MIFKPILLLFITNLAFSWPIFVFLKAPFFIPTIAALLVFDIYLCFFYPNRVLKFFDLQHFAPNDAWKVTPLFEELKKTSSLNVHIYKTKNPFPLSFCFGSPKSYHIVLSEDLLETFSNEDLRDLLTYYFVSCSQKGRFSLTLLSGILHSMDRFFWVLTFPFKGFKPRSLNSVLIGFLFFFKWFTRSLFFKWDTFAKTKIEKKRWAFFVWKIDSLYQLEKRDFPIALAPLCLTNPLTNLKGECYIALQPKVRLRVEKLIDSYPP